MPLYDYKCKACEERHEIIHGMDDERPTTCPSCGEEALVRVLHAPPVQFGPGFPGNDMKKKDASWRQYVKSKNQQKP